MQTTTDPTTRRAEQIREATGIAWERACLMAERERDDEARLRSTFWAAYKGAVQS